MTNCPVVHSPTAAALPSTNHCILCGLGPFKPDDLASHFPSCFDSFCPIGRPNAAPLSERLQQPPAPPRHAYAYLNTFAGSRMPDIFSH
ncbi:hypothetical protein SPRG_08596 [Saprolegnia parasitica CBS 223.65]|uniref:Uncharacterized protein n=1 Tax=Saprolegnia parasitica (strain CBS 223.65) TaxID=695850 RepID=A0A067CHB1_SAPPC|nr:hypothetical protein SPRG_08596 [Saprolegnia parasitica CBS 223.65]KDO25941.1 hypothetical protein SPRG_08596 [Saprolegnia parasitica CBS 223.65]|eukprot:XP_012203230.1 hypothetical protein SPRG_08596 [Saprolegnia parasitica CBS 223.65]